MCASTKLQEIKERLSNRPIPPRACAPCGRRAWSAPYQPGSLQIGHSAGSEYQSENSDRSSSRMCHCCTRAWSAPSHCEILTRCEKLSGCAQKLNSNSVCQLEHLLLAAYEPSQLQSHCEILPRCEKLSVCAQKLNSNSVCQLEHLLLAAFELDQPQSHCEILSKCTILFRCVQN